MSKHIGNISCVTKSVVSVLKQKLGICLLFCIAVFWLVLVCTVVWDSPNQANQTLAVVSFVVIVLAVVYAYRNLKGKKQGADFQALRVSVQEEDDSTLEVQADIDRRYIDVFCPFCGNTLTSRSSACSKCGEEMMERI